MLEQFSSYTTNTQFSNEAIEAYTLRALDDLSRWQKEMEEADLELYTEKIHFGVEEIYRSLKTEFIKLGLIDELKLKKRDALKNKLSGLVGESDYKQIQTVLLQEENQAVLTDDEKEIVAQFISLSEYDQDMLMTLISSLNEDEVSILMSAFDLSDADIPNEALRQLITLEIEFVATLREVKMIIQDKGIDKIKKQGLVASLLRKFYSADNNRVLISPALVRDIALGNETVIDDLGKSPILFLEAESEGVDRLDSKGATKFYKVKILLMLVIMSIAFKSSGLFDDIHQLGELQSPSKIYLPYYYHSSDQLNGGEPFPQEGIKKDPFKSVKGGRGVSWGPIFGPKKQARTGRPRLSYKPDFSNDFGNNGLFNNLQNPNSAMNMSRPTSYEQPAGSADITDGEMGDYAPENSNILDGKKSKQADWKVLGEDPTGFYVVQIFGNFTYVDEKNKFLLTAERRDTNNILSISELIYDDRSDFDLFLTKKVILQGNETKVISLPVKIGSRLVGIKFEDSNGSQVVIDGQVEFDNFGRVLVRFKPPENLDSVVLSAKFKTEGYSVIDPGGPLPSDLDIRFLYNDYFMPERVNRFLEDLGSSNLSTIEKANEIKDLVKEHFLYSTNPKYSTAYHKGNPWGGFVALAWKEGKGDCDVVNSVLLAFLRRAGISSVMAVGYSNNRASFLGKDSEWLEPNEAHGVVLVWAEEMQQWIMVDATPDKMDEWTRERMNIKAIVVDNEKDKASKNQKGKHDQDKKEEDKNPMLFQALAFLTVVVLSNRFVFYPFNKKAMIKKVRQEFRAWRKEANKGLPFHESNLITVTSRFLRDLEDLRPSISKPLIEYNLSKYLSLFDLLRLWFVRRSWRKIKSRMELANQTNTEDDWLDKVRYALQLDSREMIELVVAWNLRHEARPDLIGDLNVNYKFRSSLLSLLTRVANDLLTPKEQRLVSHVLESRYPRINKLCRQQLNPVLAGMVDRAINEEVITEDLLVYLVDEFKTIITSWIIDQFRPRFRSRLMMKKIQWNEERVEPLEQLVLTMIDWESVFSSFYELLHLESIKRDTRP